MLGKYQRGQEEERMSSVQNRDPRHGGDRDELSAQRRLFVIIGIALTQHSGTHHTQENEERYIHEINCLVYTKYLLFGDEQILVD